MLGQAAIISVEDLVDSGHPYREFKKMIDFNRIQKCVKLIEYEKGANGYGKNRLILCLILQFLEDLSDRELERFLRENTAGKWFADFELIEKTPDYSTFCKFRKFLGTKNMGRVFDEVNRQLKAKGMLREVFTFVGAAALTSKLNVWEERDKAIQAGCEKFNNEVAEKKQFSADKDARFGCKNKNKYWFGYKKNVSVDTQTELIQKAAVTKANIPDADAELHVLPKFGAVLADKGYIPIIDAIVDRGLHSMVILKKNMKNKIPELDKWISHLRSPYERTFSKQNKRVRYRGIVKNQGAEFLYAAAYNLKIMLTLKKNWRFDKGVVYPFGKNSVINEVILCVSTHSFVLQSLLKHNT
jgi:IS5 family transposase